MVGLALAAGFPGWGQMHKVAKPEQVVRAVGVYEWTGDMAKPTASRLIPVSLAIDGQLQDAGVYLARPVPFALETGNVYSLQDAGIDKGTLDLVYARHLQGVDRATGDTEYDDGWFGYGNFQPLAAEKKKPALKASKTLSVITTGAGDQDRPHFSKKEGGDAAGGDSTAPSTTAGGASADPDRPTMKRRSEGGSGDSANSSGASSGTVPADDPDRPTLKRRSPEEEKKARKDDVASVTGTGSLNDDPNRPNLHRGKPASAMTEADLPRLVGLPPDLHQMAAVSDAANREPHEFARNWEDAAERAAVLQKMEAMARVQLVIYGGTAAAEAPAPVARRGTPVSKLRRGRAAAAPIALMDEVLKGYTLSYGGDATYVYMAHTPGTGADLRYVTVVAQADGQGELKAAIQSVTDAAHLDRTPRMRCVDAVDAQASNRASLLVELRAQNSRQFALYRVIAGKADQLFLSGSTQ
jgi:hypothetical protein